MIGRLTKEDAIDTLVNAALTGRCVIYTRMVGVEHMQYRMLMVIKDYGNRFTLRISWLHHERPKDESPMSPMQAMSLIKSIEKRKQISVIKDNWWRE